MSRNGTAENPFGERIAALTWGLVLFFVFREESLCHNVSLILALRARNFHCAFVKIFHSFSFFHLGNELNFMFNYNLMVHASNGPSFILLLT